MTAAELAERIDHTLLKPEATPDQIDRLCDEALEFGFKSVCVNPVFVSDAARRLGSSAKTVVCTVVNFPLGASLKETVVGEARRAIELGATEVDMVVWIGGLIAGETERVTELIRETGAVVHAGGGDRVLKVILETGGLSDDRIVLGCRCGREGGADFVKTSTGFHSGGGATVKQVALLRRCAKGLKVKASGGIRDLATAQAMMAAGADRLGTSAGGDIIRQLRGVTY